MDYTGISIFGEFSTGKSTFLNALMGEDILSVATEPTTATPTRIQWARAFNVLVFGKPTSPGAEPRVIASQFPVGAEPVWARLMKDGVLATLQHETSSIRRFLEAVDQRGPGRRPDLRINPVATTIPEGPHCLDRHPRGEQ